MARNEKIQDKRMKTFKQFMREQKESVAPQGIIFKGDKVVFVGAEHETPIKLSNELLAKVKMIGSKYGYWYEGSGGDADTNAKTFGGRKSYQGSWDDDFRKDVKGYPYQFIYTLFANTKVNGQKESITDSKLSIFDSIIKNQKKFGFFKDKEYGTKELTEFLRKSSEDTTDFLSLSKQQATKENVNDFIDKGEELSWPKNWEKYPNNAGKIAKEANDARDKFLLNRTEGVYFAGAGHLKSLIELDKTLKMIGGEEIE